MIRFILAFLLTASIGILPVADAKSHHNVEIRPQRKASVIRLHRIKRRKRKPQFVTFTVTAYTDNDATMNGLGVTADGKRTVAYQTVAASQRWPFGTTFKTPDGQIWRVDDRGGAITGDRLDLYVGDDRQTALDYGVREVTVEVVKIGKER